MGWFKVDDKLHSHPKRWAAGLPAMGLWAVAGSWAAGHETDGFVPKSMVSALGGRANLARTLCEVGLWEEVESGYCFHDWEAINPRHADLEAQRAAHRERTQKWRDKARSKKTGRFEGVATAEAEP